MNNAEHKRLNFVAMAAAGLGIYCCNKALFSRGMDYSAPAINVYLGTQTELSAAATAEESAATNPFWLSRSRSTAAALEA